MQNGAASTWPAVTIDGDGVGADDAARRGHAPTSFPAQYSRSGLRQFRRASFRSAGAPCKGVTERANCARCRSSRCAKHSVAAPARAGTALARERRRPLKRLELGAFRSYARGRGLGPAAMRASRTWRGNSTRDNTSLGNRGGRRAWRRTGNERRWLDVAAAAARRAKGRKRVDVFRVRRPSRSHAERRRGRPPRPPSSLRV